MNRLIQSEDLDRIIDIEKPVSKKGFGAAGTETWESFYSDAPAQVQDALPSRAERLSDGMNITTRRARVRMRWFPGLTDRMRVIYDGRAMQIVSGPAEIGRQDGWEFIIEAITPSGGGR